MANVRGRSPFADKQSSSLVFEEFVPPSAWTEDSTCHYLLVDLPGFKKHELKLQVDNRTHIIVSGETQVRENKYKRFEQRFELPNDAELEKITGKVDGEILYVSVPKKVGQEHKEIKHDSIPKPAQTVSHKDNEDDYDKKSDTFESADEQEQKHIKHGSISARTPAPASESDSDSDSEDNDKAKHAYETEESDNKDGEKDIKKKKHGTSFDDHWGQDAELFLRLAMEKLKKNKSIVATAIFAFSLGVWVTQKFQSNGN